METAVITTIGTLLGGVVTAIGYIIVANIQKTADIQEANRAAKVDELAKVWERYNILEIRVASLETVFRAAATFIDRIGVWWQAGGNPPPPKPPQALYEYIDITLWERDE